MAQPQSLQSRTNTANARPHLPALTWVPYMPGSRLSLSGSEPDRQTLTSSIWPGVQGEAPRERGHRRHAAAPAAAAAARPAQRRAADQAHGWAPDWAPGRAAHAARRLAARRRRSPPAAAARPLPDWPFSNVRSTPGSLWQGDLISRQYPALPQERCCRGFCTDRSGKLRRPPCIHSRPCKLALGTLPCARLAEEARPCGGWNAGNQRHQAAQLLRAAHAWQRSHCLLQD